MSSMTATESAARIEVDRGNSSPSLIETLRELHDRSRFVLAGGLAGVALLIVIFWANVRHFVWTWSSDANYSHGFLVPLISLYFANEAVSRGRLRVRSGIGLGVGLLLLSILGRMVTILVPIGFLGDLAFLAGLAGIVSVTGGSEVLRRLRFPLFFLVFMVPLPIALYTAIATPLQLWVSRTASLILNAIGIPVLCQGNLMTLPGGVQMFVAEACSGMRQLTGFLALTTAVAYLSAQPGWVRAILIASAVPVAMTANVIRVVVTGLIMFYVNPAYASGNLHMIEGLLLMGVGLVLLGGESRLLSWAFPAVPEPGTLWEKRHDTVRIDRSERSRASIPMTSRVSLLLGVLSLGFVATTAVVLATERPRPLLRAPLAQLPIRLGSWIGQDVPVAPEIIERSQCDEYINRAYEDPSHPGRRVMLWINYSQKGLNLRHSPEICLPSGGWEKIESETAVLTIDRPKGERHRLTRLAYRQGELVQGVGFWYYIFGEGSVERFVRGLPITSQSSHGRATRGSGMTVEVFCSGAGEAQDAALRDFASALLDELDAHLPDDRAAYHRP